MTRAAKRFALALLLATMVVIGVMLKQIGAALLIATVFAVLLWPLQQWLTKRLRGRRAAAATVLCAGVVTLIIAPVVSLSAVVIHEASDGVKFVTETVESEGMMGLIGHLPDPLERGAKAVIARLPREPGKSLDKTLTDELSEQVGAQGGKAAAVVSTAVVATGTLVLHVCLMVVALFCFLTRGDECVGWLAGASPLGSKPTHELLVEFKKVSFSVIISTFLTALAQAAVAEVGYLIARVPNPLFFGALTLVFAVIPAVGGGSVCFVAALLLFVTGHTGFAVFLALWAVLVVGLIDNLLKPLIVRGRVQMNGGVVFFALIGGLAAFGALGLLIGPICVAFFLTLLRIYHRDVEA